MAYAEGATVLIHFLKMVGAEDASNEEENSHSQPSLS